MPTRYAHIAITVMLFCASFIAAADFDAVTELAKSQGFSGVINDVTTRHRFTSINGSFTPHSQFAIGSVSKLFTQMAILQLAERGKLNLNDPIASYLYPITTPPAWESWIHHVRIIDLLQHRSGLPALLYPHEGQLAIYNHRFEKKSLAQHLVSADNAEIDDAVLSHNLDNADESGEFYSNMGYNLLAQVIENASGLNYENYIQQAIFEPADMQNSFSGNHHDNSFLKLANTSTMLAMPQIFPIQFNAMSQQDTLPHLQLKPSATGLTTDYNFVFAIGAGSIISTTEDLEKWLTATFDQQCLLQKKSLQQLIALDSEDGIWGHQGELPGYQSVLFYNLQNRQRLIILSNRQFDMKAYLDEVRAKGRHITALTERGGLEGIEKELIQAFNERPYAFVLNIALDLLSI